MSLESFRRNLRGVNDNSDFPPEFLDEIYYSIVKVGDASHIKQVGDASHTIEVGRVSDLQMK
jgi:hypothetical protein